MLMLVRNLWLLLGFVVLAMYALPLVFGLPLLDPDEGLHATVAQEMVERGDYVTPRLLGVPFFDKPVLYFWLQAASLRAFGMHEWAVRLPGLICGVLGGLTTGLLARRLWGELAAPLAALMYLTMVVPLALAQAAVHDVALVPLTNLALWCLWSADEQRSIRQAWRWYAASGVFLGLAILTKGLVGAALVGLAFGAYLLVARRLSWLAVFGLAVAGAIAVLVALPWYWRMHVLNPGYLHYYFVERHVQGFTTVAQRHGGRPWWYYLPILLGGSLPWTAELVALAVQRLTGGLRGSTSDWSRQWLFVGCWVAADVLFLSAAGSKLWTYCLPVFPALAIAVTIVWRDYLSGKPGAEPAWYRASLLMFSILAGALALPASIAIAAKVFALHVSPGAWLAAGLIGPSLVVWRVCWYRRWYWGALVTMQGSLALHLLYAMTVILPSVADNSTAKVLAEHFNRLQRVPERLIVVDDRLGSLSFYLSPELRAQLVPRQIETVLREHLAADPQQARGATVVVSNRVFPKLPADSPFRSAPCQHVGRFRLYDGADPEN